MKSKALILMAVAGLLFQAACGEKREKTSGEAAQPVRAQVMTARYESVPVFVEAPGTVQARNRISIASQINGFIREMHVRAGDVVRKDQLLAMLDSRDAQGQKAAAQASIEEAQAALSEAQKSRQAAIEMKTAAKASTELAGQTLIRYQKLFDSRSVSPQEIDEVRTRRDASAAELASRDAMVAAADDRIKQVEARISQAKAQSSRTDVLLSWTVIKSPVAGKIVQRLADPGTAIFPGTPLMVIESMEKPQVLAEMPTEQANLLRIGAPATIRSTETGAATEGRIAEIVPQSNPLSHSMQFKVDIPSQIAMLSGQYVRVEIPSGNRKALLVPKTAIRQTGQITGTFIVDNAKAHFRLVKIASYDRERVEAISGVEPGEKIVSELSDQIVDGIPVTER